MFSFRDHLVQVTPDAGPFAGQPFRLLSGNDIEVDPGPKAKAVPGFSELPFAIVRQSAEPKIKLSGMDAVEVDAVRTQVGGIGGFAYTISVVASRPGVKPFRIKCGGCSWSGGGGWKADDNGSMSEVESLMLELKYNGVDVFAVRHPR